MSRTPLRTSGAAIALGLASSVFLATGVAHAAPAQPGTTDAPSKPAKPAPAQPGTTDAPVAPTQPSKPAPAQPGTTDAPSAPVQEAPVQQTAPVQQEPVTTAPVQQEPVQTTPVQEAPVQQTAPVQQEPVTTTPVQEAPVTTTPVQQEPVQTTPVQEAPAQQETTTPVEQAPAQQEAAPVDAETVAPEAPEAPVAPAEPEVSQVLSQWSAKAWGGQDTVEITSETLPGKTSFAGEATVAGNTVSTPKVTIGEVTGAGVEVGVDDADPTTVAFDPAVGQAVDTAIGVGAQVSEATAPIAERVGEAVPAQGDYSLGGPGAGAAVAWGN